MKLCTDGMKRLLKQRGYIGVSALSILHCNYTTFFMATTSSSSGQLPSPSQMQSSQSFSGQNNGQASPNSNKPADYVYFERTTAGFSDDAIPRAKAAQLKLEHYYKVAVDAAIERNTR